MHVALRGISTIDTGDGRRTLSRSRRRGLGRICAAEYRGELRGNRVPGGNPGNGGRNTGAERGGVRAGSRRLRSSGYEAFDLERHAFVEFTAQECGFAYRRSRFNTVDRGRYIVTGVDYRLTPGGAPSVRYADLRRALAENDEPSLRETADAVRSIRLSKGMLLVEGDPDCRSAGSFFKNPVVGENHAVRIAVICGEEPPRFPVGGGVQNAGKVKIPAAWLIERAGFAKGYRLGAAGISSRHTLALINLGGATAAEIVALAAAIRQAVRRRFDIEMEMEPVLVGF